jgi:AcrR family transcriptional regulator
VRDRARRSHAERRARTRARIIEAVVESIGTVGFQRTTAAEIASRAGVTWGAVQHHFGGKDGMLAAVVEDSFDHFARRLEDVALEANVIERVGLFVDRAWEHFGSERYRTTFEILLNSIGRDGVDGGAWRAQMARAWGDVWDRIFWDSALPRRRSRMVQHYTIAVLSGLASTLLLQGERVVVPRHELGLLKATLVRELTATDATGP